MSMLGWDLLYIRLDIQVHELHVDGVLLSIFFYWDEGLVHEVPQLLPQNLNLRLLLTHCFQQRSGRPKQPVQNVLKNSTCIFLLIKC